MDNIKIIKNYESAIKFLLQSKVHLKYLADVNEANIIPMVDCIIDDLETKLDAFQEDLSGDVESAVLELDY